MGKKRSRNTGDYKDSAGSLSIPSGGNYWLRLKRQRLFLGGFSPRRIVLLSRRGSYWVTQPLPHPVRNAGHLSLTTRRRTGRSWPLPPQSAPHHHPLLPPYHQPPSPYHEQLTQRRPLFHHRVSPFHHRVFIFIFVHNNSLQSTNSINFNNISP